MTAADPCGNKPIPYQVHNGSSVGAYHGGVVSTLNKNSLLYWWPKIKDLGIPVPETRITALDATAVRNAAAELNYPVFLRTDLCSGKHDWNASCFVSDESKVYNNLAKVIESNVRWQMLGIFPQAAVVREFIDLESSFTAFVGDMPITKERRYFVRDTKVLCRHAYWPESAFNNHPARMANGANWRGKLATLNTVDSSELILDSYAETVSRALEGFWSVDFAKAKNGKWYLLDMALGENSYHWPECERNKA